jgi:hypothetical protein
MTSGYNLNKIKSENERLKNISRWHSVKLSRRGICALKQNGFKCTPKSWSVLLLLYKGWQTVPCRWSRKRESTFYELESPCLKTEVLFYDIKTLDLSLSYTKTSECEHYQLSRLKVTTLV